MSFYKYYKVCQIWLRFVIVLFFTEDEKNQSLKIWSSILCYWTEWLCSFGRLTRSEACDASFPIGSDFSFLGVFCYYIILWKCSYNIALLAMYHSWALFIFNIIFSYTLKRVLFGSREMLPIPWEYKIWHTFVEFG